MFFDDQEARPADKASGPDPGQSAAHSKEGLQLQVFSPPDSVLKTF